MKPPFWTPLFYLLKLNFIVIELIRTIIKVGQKSISWSFETNTDAIMCYLAGHRFNFYTQIDKAAQLTLDNDPF